MKKFLYKVGFNFVLIIFAGLILPSAVIMPVLNGQLEAAGETNVSYEKVVSNLKDLISSTPLLKGDIDKALKIQKKDSHWYGKTSADFVKFFEEWLVYNIGPKAPGKYIMLFDELANSGAGEILFNNNVFSSWFIEFLDARGQYLGSKDSTENIAKLMADPVIKIKDYNVPEGGFKNFNEFFLRTLKPGARPLAGKDDPAVIVSPADGTIHQIYIEGLDTNFKVKRDVINMRQALNDSPYAEKFIGGEMVDVLLWFTDYHHFHAPVSGEIVEMDEYPGSYNYNFPNPNWYRELAKHKRLCYIIQSEKFGLVAMIPVGFWGVGSIITERKEGDYVKKGDELGYFAYGGSSILLIFEPQAIKFTIPLGEKPTPVRVREKIGVANNPVSEK